MEVNGAYALILEFESPLISIDAWRQKQEKMTRYFGPGVKVEVTQIGSDKIELALITQNS